MTGNIEYVIIMRNGLPTPERHSPGQDSWNSARRWVSEWHEQESVIAQKIASVTKSSKNRKDMREKAAMHSKLSGEWLVAPEPQ